MISFKEMSPLVEEQANTYTEEIVDASVETLVNPNIKIQKKIKNL